MALIEFKNLPDTSTPLNAENLNNNFNELNNKIDNVPTFRSVWTGLATNGDKVSLSKADELINGKICVLCFRYAGNTYHRTTAVVFIGNGASNYFLVNNYATQLYGNISSINAKGFDLSIMKIPNSSGSTDIILDRIIVMSYE